MRCIELCRRFLDSVLVREGVRADVDALTEAEGSTRTIAQYSSVDSGASLTP